MNKNIDEILIKFREAKYIKDFQLYCAKNYDVIPNIRTAQRWASKEGRPHPTYINFIINWDKQYVG
tara:strand:- start:27116 stop:27313 length:198 start_codon:yes stop_codon:yes gene_type:complete